MPEPWPARQWPEAVPRYATQRNPDRDTLGPEVCEVARRLGFEPMPWQRDAWDVQYELDDKGALWYREVRITVPRQSAKTTSTLVRHVHRCTHSEKHGWGNRPVAAFTAQHASDAREKMVNEWMPVVEFSGAYSGDYTLRRSNGLESFLWHNGARMITFAPNAVGAHGATLDLVDIDEAFAFIDNRVETGCRPAMITRKSPQLVVQSTAGDANSVYLRSKVDDGRARVERGDDGHVMYLEYSVGPGDDINNPEHWPRFMPALGYTIDIDAVKLEHSTMSPDEFYRAFGNGWTGSTKQVIPAAKWAACYAPKTPRGEGKVWMAVDTSPGGSGGRGRMSSVAVASYRGDVIHCEVIKHGPGLSWVPAAIGELTRRHRVQTLWLDPAGPIGQVLSDIRDVSMANIELVDARTMAAACGRYHQAVLDGTTAHRNQDMLNAAVAGAVTRQLEDAWAWKRRTSTSDIAPLVAVTLAHWAAAINKDRGPIVMYTGT